MEYVSICHCGNVSWQAACTLFSHIEIYHKVADEPAGSHCRDSQRIEPAVAVFCFFDLP